jgi:hypothetical protein
MKQMCLLIVVSLLLWSCEKKDSIPGVIKDSKTGLWWAQDAGAAPMSLSQAIDYVHNLRLGGYSDWRIPHHKELESLLSYDSRKNEGPDKLRKMGFINVRSTCYWVDPENYKDVGFFIAGAGGSSMIFGAIGVSATCSVWPVRWGKGLKEYDEAKRSGLSSYKAREIKRDDPFIAFDNGTVLDTRTDLMWAAKDNGSDITLQNAKSFCENYRGGGYTDWRLPSQDELGLLYDRRKSYKFNNSPDSFFNTVHLTDLIQVSGGNIWASDTRDSEVADFSFDNGAGYWCREPCTSTNRVLPVRSSR